MAKGSMEKLGKGMHITTVKYRNFRTCSDSTTWTYHGPRPRAEEITASKHAPTGIRE
jgi:hypothetical protein